MSRESASSSSSPYSSLDKTQLRALMATSDALGLVKIFQHGMAILVAVVLLANFDHWLMQGLMIIVLGGLLNFLFAPLHETIHKTAFKSPQLNAVVGWFSGLVLVLPPKYFQAFHMAHHRYTQIAGKDPELDHQKPTTSGQYLRHLSGLDYWSGQVKVLVLFAIGNHHAHHRAHFVSDRKQPAIVREARIFLAIYFLLLSFSLLSASALLWKYWLLPMLLGQPLLRAFLLAEHALCPLVSDMLHNTRTTLTNKLMRWVCWNMSFHVEHHVYPAIPFHRLPAAHRLLKPHISIISNGYIAVNREVLHSL